MNSKIFLKQLQSLCKKVSNCSNFVKYSSSKKYHMESAFQIVLFTLICSSLPVAITSEKHNLQNHVWKNSIDIDYARSSNCSIDECFVSCRNNSFTYAHYQNNFCQCGNKGSNQQVIHNIVNFKPIYSTCELRYYGRECDKVCHCGHDMPCNVATGLCDDGCEEGWTGEHCHQRELVTNETTSSPYYLQCVRNFPINETNDNITLPQCFNECSSNNTYTRFQFPSNCSCLQSIRKSTVNISVCKEHWEAKTLKSAFVLSACPHGSFGPNCLQKCHCKDMTPCTINGSCVFAGGQCQPGWMGSQCNLFDCNHLPSIETCKVENVDGDDVTFVTCKDGYTMKHEGCVDINECEQGACDKDTSTCHNIEGSYECTCLQGFEYVNQTYCTDVDECQNSTTHKCDNTTTNCLNSIGSYTCECKEGFKKSFNSNTSCEDINECSTSTHKCNVSLSVCTNNIGSYICSCNEGYKHSDNSYINCNDIDECKEGTSACNQTTSTCLNTPGSYECTCHSEGHYYNYTTHQCYDLTFVKEDSNTVQIVTQITVVVLLLVVLCFVGVLAFIKLRKKKNTELIETNDKFVDELALKNQNETITSSNKIAITSLPTYYESNLDLIEREFKNTPKEIVNGKFEISKLENNKNKNRFKNILPYDHNIVPVSTSPNKSKTEYINASFIHSYKTTKPTIIATQGPNNHTISNFWKMICQYNVKVIVMLAQCFEEGKSKCNTYWPETDPVKFGSIKISLISVKIWTHYIMRQFNVISPDKNMTVVQLHYVTWPDKGVPLNKASILSLREKVRLYRNESEFLVVHCSAGVGRTGTFIAIDYLIKQLEQEQAVDFLNCMVQLRKDRPQMIQTLDQYKFCFSTLVLHHLVGKTSIPTTDKTDTLASINQLLYTEDGNERLKSQHEIMSKSCSSEVPEVSKYYSSSVDEMFDGIFLKTFQSNVKFICATFSEKATVSDVFKIIKDNDGLTIWLDDEKPFIDLLKNSQQYESDEYITTLKNYTDVEFGKILNFELHDKNNIYANSETAKSTLERTMFYVPATNQSQETEVYNSLFQYLKSYTEMNPEHHVFVVDRCNYKKSGYFVTCYNMMFMMREHDEVNVMEIVWDIKNVQKKIIPNYQAYEELFVFLKSYIEVLQCTSSKNNASDDHIYSNNDNGVLYSQVQRNNK